MSRRCCPVMLLLLLCGLLALPARAQEAPATVPDTINLQPKFVAGQVTRYHLWTLRQQTRQSPAFDRSFTTTFEIAGEATWQVQRVNADGSASCLMTLDYLEANITLPDGTVRRVDSRKPQGDLEEMHQLLQAMSGLPVEVQVASDGTILGVSGLERMRQRDTVLQLPDEIDFMETAYELTQLPHAPAQARIGDSWSASFTWNREMGQLQQKTQYRVDTVEQIEGIPVATLSATSQLRFDPDLSDLPQGGPPVTIRMTEGSLATQVMFDLQRREAVGRNSTERRVIEVNVTLPQQTVRQVIEENVQSQALRISEQ